MEIGGGFSLQGRTEDALALLRDSAAALRPGWVLLSGGALRRDAAWAEDVEAVLIHAEVGVALLGAAPAAEVAGKLRQSLDAAGFREAFGGLPPIIYRVLPPPGLPLQEVLDQAFEIEPALSLSERADWTRALQDVVATPGSPERSAARQPRRGFAPLLAASLALAMIGAAALALHDSGLFSIADVEQTTASAGNGSGGANGTPDPTVASQDGATRQAPSVAAVGTPDIYGIREGVAEAGAPVAPAAATMSPAAMVESSSTGPAPGLSANADDLLPNATLPDPTAPDDPSSAALALAAPTATDDPPAKADVAPPNESPREKETSLATEHSAPIPAEPEALAEGRDAAADLASPDGLHTPTPIAAPEGGIALEAVGPATPGDAPAVQPDEIAPPEETASTAAPGFAEAMHDAEGGAGPASSVEDAPRPPAPPVVVSPPPAPPAQLAAPVPHALPDQRRQERQQPGPTAEAPRADADRCRSVVISAQLGELLSPARLALLRARCGGARPERPQPR